MTNVNVEEMRAQALKSVADLHSDNISVSGEKSLESERDNPEFEKEFVALNHLLADVDELRHDADIQALMDDALIDPPDSKAVVAGRWFKWSIAASLLLSLFVGSYLYFVPELVLEDSLSRYVSRVGEQKTITLEDGSIITMNTGTLLLADATGNERRVILERGEAYFDIESDPNRPFKVSLGDKSVTVLGTEFNIQRDLDGFELAVTEGEVVVHNTNDVALSEANPLVLSTDSVQSIPADNQARVRAGWQLTYSDTSNQFLAETPEDINLSHQWRTGMLKFSKVPLYEVVKELNRYSGRKILIEDKGIMDLEIYAALRVDRIESALMGLEQGNPIKLKKYFDRIVVVGSDKD
ncbi:FecR domain-containing protein [Porticoccaceae bacterium LTM1]|nr:FecR domain-containing protein [Porticoccaceae bacterium LTM1]